MSFAIAAATVAALLGTETSPVSGTAPHFSERACGLARSPSASDHLSGWREASSASPPSTAVSGRPCQPELLVANGGAETVVSPVPVVSGWLLVSQTPIGTIQRAANPAPFVVVLRAEGRVSAPAWAVREVILDPVRHLGAANRAIETIVRSGECVGSVPSVRACRHLWVHQRYPGGIVDARVATLEVERNEDGLDKGGAFDLRWQLAPDGAPAPEEGCVVVRASAGGWHLEPDGEGTRFKYDLALDPGGTVPRWLVGWSQERELPRFLRDVERAAARLAAGPREERAPILTPAPAHAPSSGPNAGDAARQ
jgi:hypothetical protein